MKATADLEAARMDYAAGMSTRALGLKYGCSKTTIRRWASKYGWKREGVPPKRPSVPRNRKPKGEPISALKAGEASANHKRLCGLAEKLMDRMSEILRLSAPLSPKDTRSLAGALLDVRQLLHAVSPLEEEEQRLKLAALQRALDESRESGSKTVTVRFESQEIEALSV